MKSCDETAKLVVQSTDTSMVEVPAHLQSEMTVEWEFEGSKHMEEAELADMLLHEKQPRLLKEMDEEMADWEASAELSRLLDEVDEASTEKTKKTPTGKATTPRVAATRLTPRKTPRSPGPSAPRSSQRSERQSAIASETQSRYDTASASDSSLEDGSTAHTNVAFKFALDDAELARKQAFEHAPTSPKALSKSKSRNKNSERTQEEKYVERKEEAVRVH